MQPKQTLRYLKQNTDVQLMLEASFVDAFIGISIDRRYFRSGVNPALKEFAVFEMTYGQDSSAEESDVSASFQVDAAEGSFDRLASRFSDIFQKIAAVTGAQITDYSTDLQTDLILQVSAESITTELETFLSQIVHALREQLAKPHTDTATDAARSAACAALFENRVNAILTLLDSASTETAVRLEKLVNTLTTTLDQSAVMHQLLTSKLPISNAQLLQIVLDASQAHEPQHRRL